MDNILSEDNAKPYLESSYSYLATRMLPDVTREYGSVRNIWDGCYQGEAFISELKSLIDNLQKNWYIKAGLHHHKIKLSKKY
eukprot:11955290-Ditylum_brightwellii.AAC.1